MTVQVSVLGSVGIRQAGADVELGPRLQRLLAALVVSNGSVVSSERLVDIVWADDPPDGAQKTLRSYVTRLRRALDPDGQPIVFRAPGYLIDLGRDELDSVSFDDELDRALRFLRIADAAAAASLLETAVARWHGAAYAGFADEEWARPEAVRLEERLLEAREALIDAKLSVGLHDEAAALAQALVESEPLRERPRALLMRALHASGRQAEALRVFDRYRRYLAEEMGLDPSADIVELERRVARGDTSTSGAVRSLRGYEIGERIGEGAFAVVHRAIQPAIERDVAIKIIRAELADRADFIRRFELEARTVARVEHPNVVPLFDFWREPGAAYLVMRLLTGGSVEQALRTAGPHSREQTIRLLDDVGGALDTAHRAGVVHRDVRPANLLLDADGTAYLADFGIALPTAAIDDLPVRSPGHAAPEVLRGEPAGIAADVFSLGVTTFEVLTGRLPFADSLERGEVIRRQLSEPLPPVRAIRTDLPAGVDDVLARATEKAAGDRYTTVAAFVDNLRSALDLAPTSGRRTPIDWRGPVDNPYVGLHAFHEEDAHRFFGREQLVAELVERLERERMVVAVGPSGSGKSSVVRAGVLPAIRRGAIAGSESWFVATMVPGTDPFDAFEAALLRIAVNPPATLREQIGQVGGLSRAVQRVLPDGRTRLVLVIDQFEELFTQADDPEERDRFLAELSDAMTKPESPLRVIATLRADHYDAPLRHASVAELVTRGTVTVRPMTPAELERAISLPASSVGIDVEPALTTELVAGISARPAALPLLQFSLTELFDRRVSDTMLLTTHHDLGGLTGALAARADRVLEAGGPDAEPEARRIFGRLVTFGEGSEDTRRRALRSEFGEREPTAQLLDDLVTARLLATDRDPTTSEPTVEVAHEALLRDWPRLRDWLARDRELRRSVGAIGLAATVWDRGERQTTDLYRGGRLESALETAEASPAWLRPLDHEFLEASRSQAEADRDLERRRVRRLRRLVAGTAVALVIALLAGGGAVTQQRRADREARDAEAAAAEADRQRDLAEARAEDATAARDDADEQRRTAERQAGIAEAATSDAELSELIARSTAGAVERPQQALLLALEAYRRAPGPASVGALLDTIASGGVGRQVASIERLPEEPCNGLVPQRRLSSDGLREFATVGTDLLVKDLVTGEVTDRGTSTAECSTWWEDRGTGARWAASGSLQEHWTSADGRSWTRVDRPVPGGALVAELVGDRLLFGQESSGTFQGFGAFAEVVVVDAASLEPVASGITDLVFNLSQPFPAAAASQRGLFAVGTAAPDTAAAAVGGLLVVLDATTGAETLRVTRPARVTSVAFDRDGRTVIAGDAGGTIARVDLASGRVIGEMTMSNRLEVIAVGTRLDDVIVAVGRRSIERFQPRGERLGEPTRIPATDEARIRPDGEVVIVPADDADTLQVIDPDSGPLVEQGWVVDPSALIGFGAGHAGVVGPSGAVELVELISGARTDLELATDDGEPFDAVAVIPEADGHLAWNDGSTVARWRAGEVVEQLDVWSGLHDVSLTQDPRRVPGERGGGFAGDGAMIVFEGPTPLAAYAFDPSPGDLEMVSTLDTPPFATTAVAPAPEGGLYVALSDGELRHYDRSGDRVRQFDTGLRDASFAIVEAATGSIALAGESGAAIVDPSTGSVQSVTDVSSVISVGFARGASLLVVVESDGAVRLWDAERAALVGTLWIGGTTAAASPPWYDEATDSIWVATSGKILQFSLDPARWVERVCGLVSRDLTPAEWDRLVPGDIPQRSACD